MNNYERKNIFYFLNLFTSDFGESLNVDPTQKKVVGERLALLALKNSYHKNIIANGPSVKSAVQKGNEIIITFSDAKKLQTRNNESVVGFELMNDRGDIFSPKAEIKNNKVGLYLDNEGKITKVLYAYKPYTRANLVNEVGLPAGTFSFEIVK